MKDFRPEVLLSCTAKLHRTLAGIVSVQRRLRKTQNVFDFVMSLKFKFLSNKEKNAEREEWGVVLSAIIYLAAADLFWLCVTTFVTRLTEQRRGTCSLNKVT